MRKGGLWLALGAAALALALASALGLGRGPASATGVVAVTAGGSHSCALTEGGGVRCWGLNSSGQLGHGAGGANGDMSAVPVDVAGLTGAIAVDAGGAHTCALLSGGRVACWGLDLSGQLGAPTSGVCTPFGGDLPFGCARTPVEVPGLSGVVDIAAGGNHTCALLEAGTVKCWGDNFYGQLGADTGAQCGPLYLVDCATAPVDVPGLDGVVAIGASTSHTCAVTEAATVKCWGLNSQGELGAPSSETCTVSACSSVPLDVCADAACSALLGGIDAVAVGSSHTCALTDAGVVRCWGGNAGGQLGRGTIELGAHPVPLDVCATASCTAALSGIESIAAGGLVGSGGHTCGVTNEGGVTCWGTNFAGQLGDGFACRNPCPIPIHVIGLGGAAAVVDAGDLHTCAVRGAGTLACWGQNASGQLGDGGTEQSTTPVEAGVKPAPGATPAATRTPTPTATPEPVLLGDASCDGRVNSIDAAFVLQHVAGLLASLPCRVQADVNRDGRADARDAALILQIDAGLLVTVA